MKVGFARTCTLTLSLVLLLTGCWDTKDINKHYLPAVMGIGKGDSQKYKVILQIPIANEKTQILEKEAESISKAIDLIRTDSEKSIDLVHLRLMLIDIQLAQDGIGDIINFAVRANDISIKGLVSIVDGDFDKTLYHQISPTPEVSSYDFFSEEAGWTPNQSILRIWEAYRNQESLSEDMGIPMLKDGKQTLFTFKGTAVMRKDRLVGSLNQEETLLYNLFKGKYTGGTIEVAKNTSVLIEHAKVNHHTKWTEQGPFLQTDIQLNVVVTESPHGKSADIIEKDLSEKLSKQFDQTWKKIHSLKADALGIGLIFRPQSKEEKIKEWKTVWFPKLVQKIDVKVNILNEIYFKEKSSKQNEGDMLKRGTKL
ncbi:Ger(x)C family spore germination protein [Paenibacillus paeoniae]|uniref:Ger(X)C family spore germination protein n=1 Tax=Paenibacillus paeoniae TaxID=2292705 RepID=A0A371PMH5_9BACL|nr:Ger(x)C family spore germination protein [Paenibacillus paeoniae]REK76859.1 Ger(x)C family spore germination protein [Paenibacillus paeoniae]